MQQREVFHLLIHSRENYGRKIEGSPYLKKALTFFHLSDNLRYEANFSESIVFYHSIDRDSF